MILFDFDWSDLLNKLVLAVAIAILPLQLWMLLFRNRQAGSMEFSGRFGLRLALNAVLWISILSFVLQPYISIPAASKVRILTARDVPAYFTEKVRDSLKAELVTLSELRKTAADTLVILGQDFDPATFATIRQLENQPVVQWVPYFGQDQIQSLTWKEIVSKGEMQAVYGSLASSKQQIIRVKYGNVTLDSAALQIGFNDFRLKFPVFTQGRTSVELTLGEQTLDTLHFFSRPAENMTVQFMLDSPDFESRALATWLGKNGNAVKYGAKLSKDLQSNQNINSAKQPDLIITDAGNDSDASVKKAFNVGKSILFINLSEPASEIASINRALGTRFQVRKISNEQNIKVTAELNALPYQFVKLPYQLSTPKYPVALEKGTGKVAVSLLSETFPMQLTGDSIAYEQVWNTILSLVRPASRRNIEMQAPVFAGLHAEISTNDFPDFRKEIRIGADTVFSKKSALNAKSGAAAWIPDQQPGWVTLQDSIPVEIFVENKGPVFNIAQMRQFVNASAVLRNASQISRANASENNVSRKLPEWFWFTWLLICFAALWVEAKF